MFITAFQVLKLRFIAKDLHHPGNVVSLVNQHGSISHFWSRYYYILVFRQLAKRSRVFFLKRKPQRIFLDLRIPVREARKPGFQPILLFFSFPLEFEDFWIRDCSWLKYNSIAANISLHGFSTGIPKRGPRLSTSSCTWDSFTSERFKIAFSFSSSDPKRFVLSEPSR